MKVSRRHFFESSAGAVVIARLAEGSPAAAKDGPSSPNFTPLDLKGNSSWEQLAQLDITDAMKQRLNHAPRGEAVCWGIPFRVGSPIVLRNREHTEATIGRKAEWIVILHCTDRLPLQSNEHGFVSPTRGTGRLGETAAEYVLVYADGSEEREIIRRRFQVGEYLGESCFEAVPHEKPHPIRPEQESGYPWGIAQRRTVVGDRGTLWVNWLWAWKNPHPDREIKAIRFLPKEGTTVISAVSTGTASGLPIRWLPRRKALLKLPKGNRFDYTLDQDGLLKQIRLDMGQVVLAAPRMIYPNAAWDSTHNNLVPSPSVDEVHIEYTAHPDARFHLAGGGMVPVKDLLEGRPATSLTPVATASRLVQIRVVDHRTNRPVPVKLHVHGSSDEYLPPVDRHRIPNGGAFEDYCAEFQNQGLHYCVYIPGETRIRLPLGKVYVEASKGFEVRPIRKTLEVKPETEVLTLTVEKSLDWRERGWVTADTHVHFLSPPTARLEGSAEGVNVINLLASQWGELMTNVGDFDGKTTFGSKDAGGDGEWLVRVGSENRQHVLGHISLLGYRGDLVAPLCTGGPQEAAIGDPIETLLMEWARECRARGGLVVLPHFPNPRCESAADLVTGVIDAIEMTSHADLYGGISPYTLSDWYRYLNCGYFVPAVGGTDKMSARTAVGTIRTYAKIPREREFTYQTWMDSVRSGHTFATYGPLLEFAVEGKAPGSRIPMRRGGGTVTVTWKIASVTVPMSRVDLIVNGEIRESRSVDPWKDEGSWPVRINRSSWAALLVRGHYEGKPEIVAAHSSPVMVNVEGSEFFAAADALTILEQIEGALAFIDGVGTRAEDEVYKRMRLKLTSAYRTLHHEMHRRGHYHDHTRTTAHREGEV